MFAAQAYSTALLCYQPILENRILLEQPSLELLFLSMFTKAEESDEEAEWMLAVDIMAEMSKSPVYNKKRDNDTMRLGRILTKCNIAKHRYKEGWKYLVKCL